MSKLKFEFECPSATIFGTVEYMALSNGKGASDPSNETELKIDWDSVQVDDLILVEDFEILKDFIKTINKMNETSPELKRAFALGILENHWDRFEAEIEKQIDEHGDWEDLDEYYRPDQDYEEEK